MTINYSDLNVLATRNYEVPEKREPGKRCKFAVTFDIHCKQFRKLENKKMKMRDVAAKLGLKPDYLKKVINMNRPTMHRDLIIAICAILHLDSDQTNDMLNKYNNMPALDNNDNGREDLIIDILEEQPFADLSIEQINDRLVCAGYPKLNLPERKQTSIEKQQENSPYDVLLKNTAWIGEYEIENLYYRDSIEAEYWPGKYTIIAEMLIEHRETHERFLLNNQLDGTYEKWRWSDDRYVLVSADYLSEDDDLWVFFEELRLLVKKEVKEKAAYLNDTKYFNKRIGAKIINRNLYVYTEEYNFSIPELNEYMLMEYKDGKFIMSIYHHSMFLQKHLHPSEFEEYFKTKKEEPLETYASIEELETLGADESKGWTYKDKISLRLKYYKEMKKRMVEFIQKLHNKEVFIRNLNTDYENPANVLAFYELSEEFECTYDKEFDEITGHLSEITYSMKNGESITLAFEDICKGYALGVYSVEEICQIKQKYGDIWEIFPVFSTE